MLAKAPLLRWMCLWTLLALLPARAQDATPDPKAPVQMALSSPFALVAKPLSLLAKRGKWFPVAVTLSNTGDPVVGEVHLKLGGAGEDPANDFMAGVDLPTNSRKVVWIYGRLERPNAQFVDISFSGRGFQTLSARVPVQEPNENQRVILSVSDADSGLGEALRGLRGGGLALPAAPDPNVPNTLLPPGVTPNMPPNFNGGSSQGPLRPLETAREGVPDRWIGLEIADLVILGDFPHSALAPPQLEALRGYVAGGGNLLALGGANAPRLSSSPLADLWPASIAGSASASAAETAQIVRNYVEIPANGRALSGADKLGGSPLVTARGPLKAGAQIKLGTRQQPLFSLQDVGAGRVLLLGFDPSQPPFNGWSGQAGLWRSVFSSSVRARALDTLDGEFAGLGPAYNSNSYYNRYGSRGYGYDNAPSDTLTGRLLANLGTAQQRRTPPVSQIAWFLALYVFVLVPLNYAVLRFIDRRELAWISIPAIVAVFSFFAYSTALSIRGKAILTRQVDIVQSSLGSTRARADSLLWLFSPRTTSYTLSSESPSAAIADYATKAGVEQGTFSIAEPVESASFRAQNAPVRIWVDRAFSGQSVADLKKGVTRVGNSIQNGTPFDLEGAVWIQDHQTRALGTIQSGGSAPIPARAGEVVGGTDFPGAIARASKLSDVFAGPTLENNIPQGALTAALGDGFGTQNEGAFLLAWGKKAAAPISIGTGGAVQSDLTLFVFRAEAFPAARATNQVAGREAIVTLVSNEPTPPQLAGAVGGGVVSYECLLPDAKSYQIEARGVGANAIPQQYSRAYRNGNGTWATPAPIPRGTLPTWVHFEVFDAAQGRWKPLPGTLRRDKSAAGGWNFSARAARELAREPDRLLKIRVRRDNDRTRISSLRVTAR